MVFSGDSIEQTAELLEPSSVIKVSQVKKCLSYYKTDAVGG